MDFSRESNAVVASSCKYLLLILTNHCLISKMMFLNCVLCNYVFFFKVTLIDCDLRDEFDEIRHFNKLFSGLCEK